MKNMIKPYIAFVQSNILFVADHSLSKIFENVFPKKSEMLSLNLPTLWELRKNEKDVEELFLHLEWPEPIGLISLVFYGEQVQLLRENQEIHSLGILHEFDIQTGDTKQALFITGIREGLDFVFD